MTADVRVHRAGTYLPPAVTDLVARWAPGRRWFPGGAAGTLSPWREVTVDGADDVVLALLRLRDDGGGDDAVVVHVPLVLTPAGETSTLLDAPGSIGTVTTPSGPVTVHDGGVHPACWAALLRAAGVADDAAAAAALAAGGRAITGEQSNTSVVLPRAVLPGADAGAMLKVLRTVAAGAHPDVVVPQALTAVGYAGVPRFLGALEVPLEVPVDRPRDGSVPATAHLAVLAELVRDARDGFELACELAGRGESFAPLAADLGTVLAGLHAAMRRALPAGGALDPRTFVAGLRRRADAAVAAAPSLAGRAADVAAVLDDLERRLTPVPLQPIHGDLHLGQALHGADGWKLLDFEGEPQRPVAERTAPDLPLRDVAGILRSVDYAAAVGGAAEPAWAADAEAAFLAAYRASAGAPVGMDDATAAAALRALVLDKALYEVVYETRQRPDWVRIPLAAVDRALSAS
ncbi:phosphotransferase [Puerhibacterium puerhi]|uniref:phosphotransferase n=1 Tax=Puerhibacterium puerhi TaxID=2692623 RepID=UPI001F404271|nr:phosphotransferase [Puerhibacterium puerhi]